MFSLKTYLDEKRRAVDAELEQILPPEDDPPEVLHAAMRYAVFSGGKRLRPVLCIAAAEAVGGDPAPACRAGAALELLHAYTLVHDDLPCMDDDDMRRGKPTVHVAYGEANAVLTGDALQALAFEVLAACAPPAPWSAADLVRALAAAAGSRGVVGGQVEDLAGLDRPLTADRLTFIHMHKTADLFRAALRIGAMSAGAAQDSVEALSRYGQELGLAFQITDDLLDATGNDAATGKRVGKDARKGKLTFPGLLGIDESARRAERLIDEACASLSSLGSGAERLGLRSADLLDALARYVLERNR